MFLGWGRDCPLAPRFHRPWRVKRRVVAWLVSAPALSRSLFGNLSKKKSPLQSTNSPRPYSSSTNAYHCQTEAKAIVSHSSDSAGILENPGTLYVKFIYSEKATKFLGNLHQLFVLCTASQIIGGDFAKFCGLLRILLACRSKNSLGNLRSENSEVRWLF